MPRLLSILGCELGQGYYISHLIGEDDFQQWVVEQNPTQLNLME